MIMMIIIIIIIFSLSNGELMMMVATWWFYFLAREFVSVCVWNSHTQRLQFFNFFSEQKYWLTEPIKKLRVTSKIIKMMIENGEKREKKKSIKWLTLLSFNDDNVIIIGQQAKLWKIYENFWQKKNKNLSRNNNKKKRFLLLFFVILVQVFSIIIIIEIVCQQVSKSNSTGSHSFNISTYWTIWLICHLG